MAYIRCGPKRDGLFWQFGVLWDLSHQYLYAHQYPDLHQYPGFYLDLHPDQNFYGD